MLNENCLCPHSDVRGGRELDRGNVRYESYQIVGSGIAVEHRYIGPIVSAMEEAGLKYREYREDFLIR